MKSCLAKYSDWTTTAAQHCRRLRELCGRAGWGEGEPKMTAEDSLRRESEALARSVGHPGELFELIQEAIQHFGYTHFSQISDDWLRLMWAIDSYRVHGIPPHGTGNPNVGPARRLGAIYRSKGNWFATLVALLLQNQTTEVVKPRVRIDGFSQLH